ncbi:hypothetical protein PLESTF_001060700 [Pleodorina starrii]|nr:hypothetical protein PLESTF_001060700 [Pleodorina starrii]
MKRRVVAHLGPTNSGKTHAALQALKAAPSGIYCGPLRLLACEVADRLAAEGLPCHLVTGQEGPAPRARHTACTIEMADVTTIMTTSTTTTTRGSVGPGASGAGGGGGGFGAPLAVAVLDEIQMLGDRLRGWAWTRALLGLAAVEVHVAGDPAVLPLLRVLVEECGDELEVRRYRRLSPLVVQSEALGSVAASAGGDCLVAFSRRALHGLRREVVRRSGREACLVYGSLPPEARRQQAALFNETPQSSTSAPLNAATGGPTERHREARQEAANGGGGGSGCVGDVEGAAGGDGSSSSGGGSEVAATEGPLGPRGRRPHPPQPHRDRDADHQPDGCRTDASESRTGRQSEPGSAGPTEFFSGSNAGSDGSSTGSAGSSIGSAPGSRVLCASDAIGMGLNLNIRRVVFTSLHKYDGASVRPLQPSEVRQIAGRAGRFSSPHPAGYVTCLRPSDLPALHRALAQPPEPITAACLLPSSEQLAAFAALHPDRPLATSLLAFAAAARLGASYVYGNYDGMYRIASALRELGGELSAEEMLLFSTAPADMDDPAVASALLRFARRYCAEGRVGPGDITGAGQPLPLSPPASEAELKRLEELHRVYDLYIWLCYRLPYSFMGREAAEAARAECGALIEEGLEQLAAAAAAPFGRRNHHHH